MSNSYEVKINIYQLLFPNGDELKVNGNAIIINENGTVLIYLNDIINAVIPSSVTVVKM